MNTYKLASILELDVIYARRIRRAARKAAWAAVKRISEVMPAQPQAIRAINGWRY